MKHILSIALVMLSLTLVVGQAPSKISFQGYVTGTGDVPLDGSFSFTFQLFDVATAGTALWTETQTNVAATDGVINVVLGSVTAINLPFNKQYYLSIKKGTDAAFTPRVALTSAPYSLTSAGVLAPNQLDNRKVVLWTDVDNDHQFYGFGINGSTLRYQIPGAGSAHKFFAGTSSSASNELMRIQGDGKVGIGTTAPAGQLSISETAGTVNGASNGTLVIDHENNGGASSVVFRSKVNRGSDYGYIQYQDAASVGAGGESARLIIGTANDADDHIAIMPSGNVGIGTLTPLTTLDVRDPTGYTGTIHVGSWNSGSEPKLIKFGDSDYVHIGEIGADDRMEIKAAIVDMVVSTAVRVNGALVHNSDRRLKKDIGEIPYGLNEILALRPVAYNWKDRIQDHKSLGLIAQDVQPLIKEIVFQINEDNDLLSVNYTELIPVLIKAIQEQQVLINELKETNVVYKAELSQYKSLISEFEKLRSDVEKLKASTSTSQFSNSGSSVGKE